MSELFEGLGLRAELLQAINELGYESPTPIQEGAIPALLSGRDVLGQAQTGTGKTAAFALPMLQIIDTSRHQVQGIILVPTRELAMQVSEAIHQYGKYIGVRDLAIYGGSSYTRQLRRLSEGVHVVVGTPGRVIDLIERGALKLNNVRVLVLDEADEMLKMGFVDDVETILKSTPKERQTALFSATLASEIRALSNRYMRDPVSVTIQHKQMTVAQTEQRYYLVDENAKVAAVARLLETEVLESALIFTRTKIGAANLAETLLSRRFAVEAIHGDLSQEMRETVLRRFRRGQVKVLVATDVAARGLDIPNVSHVVNFDMPYDPEDYVHRIGRTGRAGREGIAVTLVTPRERRWLRTIEIFTRQPIARGKLPSAEDVIAQRDMRFQEQLIEGIDALATTSEGDRAYALLKRITEIGYDPMQVAAVALRMARADELTRPVEEIVEPRLSDRPRSRDSESGRSSYGSGGQRFGNGGRGGSSRSSDGEDRPPRSRGGEAGMVRLSINLGREQGIKPGDVVGAIASEAGIPGKAIGAIDIRRNETFFDVSEAHVDRVLKMSRATVRGQQMMLKRAADETRT